MMPFDDYPREGCQLLGALDWDNAGGEGLAADLRRRTGTTSCAYCGVSLPGNIQHSHARVEHVVPVGEAMRLGLPMEFAHDVINTVLCCVSCARLSSGYLVPERLRPIRIYPGAMINLRDEVFLAKKDLIAERTQRQRRPMTRSEWESGRRYV